MFMSQKVSENTKKQTVYMIGGGNRQNKANYTEICTKLEKSIRFFFFFLRNPGGRAAAVGGEAYLPNKHA